MRLAAFLAATAATLALTACSQPAEAPADTPAPAAPQEVEVPPSVPTPPASQTPAPTGAERRACEAEIGRAAADRLVERCRTVSPATRPPCNVANPCEMIRNEIDRSCALYGPGEEKPAECAA